MFPLLSHAGTYHCDVDGKTLESDKPCVENLSNDKSLGQQLVSKAVNTKKWNIKEISKYTGFK